LISVMAIRGLLWLEKLGMASNDRQIAGKRTILDYLFEQIPGFDGLTY